MHGMFELLHFNAVNYAITVVVFFGLLVVLGKFVWGPVLKALDDRDSAILNDLDTARKNREEAELLLAEQKKAMAEMRDEARRLREEAVALAEKEKASLIEAAKLEYAKTIARAKEDIHHEREAAIEDIRKMAVGIGVSLAGRILRKEIDSATHKSFLDAAVGELEKSLAKVD